MAVNNAVRMALCIECSPAVQEVPGSIPDCDAYAEDVGGPGQAPTTSLPLQRQKNIIDHFVTIKSKLRLLHYRFNRK
jgi:hypothetical protein